MSENNNSRRRFVTGAAAASLATVTGSVQGRRIANSNNERLTGTIARAVGSDAIETPPFEMVALNRLGFGPRRTQLGPLPEPPNPDVMFEDGFDTPSGNSEAGRDDVSYFLSLGKDDEQRLSVYLDQQFDPELPDPDFDSRFGQYANEFSTLDDSRTTLFRQRECRDFNTYARPLWEVERNAFNRAVYSRRQLFELMVDFWHNHLNIFGGDSNDSYVSWPDWDRNVIRRYAFGNFYQMIYASARHPAMLRYLDNYVNSKAGFNENYARELIELHTMGAESYYGTLPPFSNQIPTLEANPYASVNDAELDSYGYDTADIPAGYVDNDVFEAAKALTGWRYSNDEEDNTPTRCGESGAFLTDPLAHEDSGKAILSRGVQLMLAGGDVLLEGRVAIKLAAYHPATANHIAKKLCRRLIADEPPQSVVDAAAATFFANRRSNRQIERTIRTIVMSPEFRDPAYFNSKIKRPFEYVASSMRAAGCDHTFRFEDDNETSNLLNRFAGAGQRLFWWRPPDGYPDRREHWEGSSGLVQAWRTIDYLLDENDSQNADRVMRVLDITLANVGNSTTPRELVEFWCGWIFGFTPTGGWAGQPETGFSTGTELGKALLRFMSQQYSDELRDANSWGVDQSISPTSRLADSDTSERWHERLRGMVALILWSPQFMQR